MICVFTSCSVVGGSYVFRVPAPAFALGPINEMKHLSFGAGERLDVVVVVTAIHPVVAHRNSIKFDSYTGSMMKVKGSFKGGVGSFNQVVRWKLTSRDGPSSFCRRRTTILNYSIQNKITIQFN